MTYYFSLLFIMLYLVRPFELAPELFRSVPVLAISGFLGLASLCFDVAGGRVKLFKNGTDQMMLGFYFAVCFSVAANGWIGGLPKTALDFFPTFAGYFLITHGMDSEKKWLGFFWMMVFCAVFISSECFAQARSGISNFGVLPLQSMEEFGEEVVFDTIRVRWVGPFSDPNDLAMLFALILTFLTGYLFKGTLILPGALVFVVGYALILTQSRGGLLSTMVGVAALYALRKGKLKSVILPSILGMIVLSAASLGRIGAISSGDESAQGRIDAWYAGLEMFKSSPLFGIGKGAFTDFHHLTAHNSLVLVMAETGFIGTFFFAGFFFLVLRSLYRVSFDRPEIQKPQMLLSAGAGVAAILTSMFFLSRSYVLLPFMVAGLWMSSANFGTVELREELRRGSSLSDCSLSVCVTTVLCIGCCFLFVKILL